MQSKQKKKKQPTLICAAVRSLKGKENSFIFAVVVTD